MALRHGSRISIALQLWGRAMPCQDRSAADFFIILLDELDGKKKSLNGSACFRGSGLALLDHRAQCVAEDVVDNGRRAAARFQCESEESGNLRFKDQFEGAGR